MPKRVHRAFGTLFSIAGIALGIRFLVDRTADPSMLVVAGGALLVGAWFWEQAIGGSRYAYGSVFTVVGVALVAGHLFEPQAIGHEMIVLGVGSLLIGAWFWGQTEQGGPVAALRREDYLGGLFLVIGLALLYSNWYLRQLENKTTLLGVGLMVMGAHYISLDKSTAILKSLASYLFPWFRSKGGDPPP